jgi:hypothetical protein
MRYHLVFAAALFVSSAMAQVRPFIDFNVLASSPSQVFADPSNGTMFIRVQEISVMNVSTTDFTRARLVWSLRPANARCDIGMVTMQRGVPDPKSFRPLQGGGNSRVQDLGSVRADSTLLTVIAVRYPAASAGCSLEAALRGNIGARAFASTSRKWHLDQ